jgi:2-C-methyl-D-erythritol 4-phosphate cytidylyltransferase
MKKYAIIVAGGTGSRMKGDIPKQFILLNGKPILQYSLEVFYDFDPTIQIILVIHPDFVEYWSSLCEKYNITIPFKVIGGGETRFDSVKNGLGSIKENGLVAIHDAARPLISVDFVTKLFFEAEKHGSAMPGIVLNDTIRIIEGDSTRQLDRTFLRSMQTPQVFRVSELQTAYEESNQTMFTDDASVMQSAGFPLHLIEGKQENIKITHLQDIAVTEAFLKLLNH